jgi:hypothetical protein
MATAHALPAKGLARLGAQAQRGSKVLYFAYGSNLNPQQVQARCATAAVVATARLDHHRVGFFGDSIIWDGALETVIPAPGQAVWGVVYALSAPALDSFDAWQDARFNGTGSYFHYPARVIDTSGNGWDVLLYKKDSLGPAKKPSQGYLDHIVRGATARGLPPGYIAALRAMATKKATYPVPVPRHGLPRAGADTCDACGEVAQGK